MEQEEFTAYVIPEIINRFPDFIRFCSHKPNGVVEIEYPSKSGKVFLLVSTFDAEITLGFTGEGAEMWHVHMDQFGAKTPEEEVNAAVMLIDEIIEDKTLIVYSSELGYYLTDDIEDVTEGQLEDEEIKLLYWTQL